MDGRADKRIDWPVDLQTNSNLIWLKKARKRIKSTEKKNSNNINFKAYKNFCEAKKIKQFSAIIWKQRVFCIQSFFVEGKSKEQNEIRKI